jgi:coproporphyrinogen III oxidase-like Fe-S oxidoreductase
MATAESTQERTGLGNYFVANYPPFSFWKAAHLPEARQALERPPQPDTPLGLYLHIPFCRKRCKFCHFRVYTDKNARDVESYTAALIKEVELYSRLPIVGGRPLHFVYFGGGTPSYLSVAQLRGLFERVKAAIPWHGAQEVTFECEPGTLQQPKVIALKELGVTRLSLGIENFSDAILEANGRAHLSPEIYRSYGWIQDAKFDQVNIDLIAGMVGENWDNWRDCIRKTIELSPDSVTIYQMELPFNTVFSKELNQAGQDGGITAVADWPTKRAWVEYSFDELGKAGYVVSSAYTMVKDPKRCHFVYRDSLWHGADMFGTGVASFGHVNGVHVQNVDGWEQYLAMLDKGELPLGRALPVEPRHMMIRELILQLKTGRIGIDYFHRKFGVDVLQEFGPSFDRLSREGYLSLYNGSAEVTRTGLMQIDRLLPEFFDPQHRGTRYT